MFNDIGKKIKVLAVILFVLCTIVAVTAGLAILTAIKNGQSPAIGLLVLFGGPVVAWISSWFTYGFGELIDKTCQIEKHLCGDSNEYETKGNKSRDTEMIERRKQIEKLHEAGMITDEEYARALLNLK